MRRLLFLENLFKDIRIKPMRLFPIGAYVHGLNKELAAQPIQAGSCAFLAGIIGIKEQDHPDQQAPGGQK